MSIETLNSYVCVPRIIDFELSEKKLCYKSITTVGRDNITHLPILKTEYDKMIKQTTNLKKQIKKLKRVYNNGIKQISETKRCNQKMERKQ